MTSLPTLANATEHVESIFNHVMDAHGGGEGGQLYLSEQFVQARKHLPALLEGNWDKSAEELQELANKLSPGSSVHNQGELAYFLMKNSFADPLLVAAMLYSVNGISAELGAMGICWTTDRRIAEWFAQGGSGEALLLSARVWKADVALTNAVEREVVVRPRKARTLKCRPAVRMHWQQQKVRHAGGAP